MSIAFATSSLAPRDRFGVWRDLMCQNFVKADGFADDPDAFDARIAVHPLGNVTLFNMAAPIQHWDRSPRHIRLAPSEDYLLTLLVAGRGTLRQADREVDQFPGDMVLYDTGLPYTYDLRGETLAVKMPRRAVLARVTSPVAVAEALSSTTPVGTLAASVLRQAANLEFAGSQSSAALVGASLLDILAALLDWGVAQKMPADAELLPSLLERVQRDLRRNLGNANLSLESIAKRHCVSTRTLARAFAVAGSSPMRWVWQERLDLALRLLQVRPSRRVTDVAYECGFSDLAHFSRTFKARFGVSPLKITRSHRESSAQDKAPH